MSNVTAVTDATFNDVVLGSDKPTLVDFWADWCAPCKRMSPILDELSEEYGDRINFVKMDTNENTVVPTQQGVLGLPTVQIYQNGQVVKQFQGAKNRSGLLKVLEEFL
ncbi:thioredoxin [Propionibacterium australiense]|uniref:Thioredoxin n=1 Tax=Propionibacterium australiense TaxID=119981 RepID=A0A383S6I9_9ACTN|nr:thioredoxin [Propionibacterium australiense]RLP08539.1 thioredoxin [Propionibacterium australiense]RLP08606.1 thioredoxin [Propionibacterium australiense]SYZ33610.1 Thioredoxin family signature [Propionibacterium australiense]VEH88803.1 Thioredoxin [Propionibacterium australiense]